MSQEHTEAVWDDGEPTDVDATSPETGDIVIDAALADLARAHPEDLDAQIEAGQHVQRTLQARLADLGDD